MQRLAGIGERLHVHDLAVAHCKDVGDRDFTLDTTGQAAVAPHPYDDAAVTLVGSRLDGQV